MTITQQLDNFIETLIFGLDNKAYFFVTFGKGNKRDMAKIARHAMDGRERHLFFYGPSADKWLQVFQDVLNEYYFEPGEHPPVLKVADSVVELIRLENEMIEKYSKKKVLSVTDNNIKYYKLQEPYIDWMRKVLVTGFEPFGGEKINPSYEAVMGLPDKIGEVQIIKRQLPVTFGGAADELYKMIKEVEPDVVICVGQAGGRKAISIEKVAINFRKTKSIPDANGYATTGERVIEDGPTAYFAALPVDKVEAAINEQGIPAEVSYTAGTYVCNDVMYSLLHAIDTRIIDKQMQGGFIHVPYATEQVVGKPEGTPALEIGQMTKALETAIRISMGIGTQSTEERIGNFNNGNDE